LIDGSSTSEVNMAELEQRQVEDYLLADKMVRRPSAMRWTRITNDHLAAAFHVEVDEIAVGSLRLVHLSAVPRHYNMNLELDSEQVCMWHVKEFGKHRNRGCPDGFPGRVQNKPHEHVWVAGRGVECIREIGGIDGLTPEESLRVFCERLSIEFRPEYVAPVFADQLMMPFEEES
jgi:hypothetical protein